MQSRAKGHSNPTSINNDILTDGPSKNFTVTEIKTTKIKPLTSQQIMQVHTSRGTDTPLPTVHFDQAKPTEITHSFESSASPYASTLDKGKSTPSDHTTQSIQETASALKGQIEETHIQIIDKITETKTKIAHLFQIYDQRCAYRMRVSTGDDATVMMPTYGYPSSRDPVSPKEL